jgi:hypothetical protein
VGERVAEGETIAGIEVLQVWGNTALLRAVENRAAAGAVDPWA